MKLYCLTRHKSSKLLKLPLYLTTVSAGFPSPADDYMDSRLDLNEHLIKHDAATFYCRVSGNSMEGEGIYDGDLLIVDRAIKPQHRSIVVASIDGGMTCKILDTHKRQLLSANPNYAPIPVGENSELCIEGVVIHSIRSHVRAG